MVHFNTRHTRFSFEHTMPAVKTGCRIGRLPGVSVVPFLTRHLRTNMIGHNCAIVGEITDRESTGFKTAGSRTENYTLGPEKMDLFFIKAETQPHLQFDLPL